MRLALTLFAGLALAAQQAGAAADPVAPDRRQLTELLAGNSMQGIWAGKHYRQYFDPAGSTLYREQDGPIIEGRWRVDDAGRDCSIWPPSDSWVCYRVLVSGSNVYWKSGGEYYPAEITAGNNFVPQ